MSRQAFRTSTWSRTDPEFRPVHELELFFFFLDELRLALLDKGEVSLVLVLRLACLVMDGCVKMGPAEELEEAPPGFDASGGSDSWGCDGVWT